MKPPFVIDMPPLDWRHKDNVLSRVQKQPFHVPLIFSLSLLHVVLEAKCKSVILQDDSEGILRTDSQKHGDKGTQKKTQTKIKH